LASRRHTTVHDDRTRAHDAGVPKTVEIELRVARAELVLQELRLTIETLAKRVIAVQAQLDHVMARFDRR
jgi:hypothetical protein